MSKGSIGTTGVQLIVAALHLFVVTNIRCQNYNWSTADTEVTNKNVDIMTQTFAVQSKN